MYQSGAMQSGRLNVQPYLQALLCRFGKLVQAYPHYKGKGGLTQRMRRGLTSVAWCAIKMHSQEADTSQAVKSLERDLINGPTTALGIMITAVQISAPLPERECSRCHPWQVWWITRPWNIQTPMMTLMLLVCACTQVISRKLTHPWK